MAYPVVHNSMKKLKEIGFVKEIGRKRGWKGVQTILYDLTDFGVSILIFKTSKPDALLRRLVKKYHDFLPEIFNLWPAFIKTGIEDLALAELRMLVCRVDYVIRPPLPHGVRKIDTDPFFIYPVARRPPEIRKRWLEAVRSDNALKQATIMALHRSASQEIGQVNEIRRLLSEPEIVSIQIGELTDKEMVSLLVEPNLLKLSQTPEFRQQLAKNRTLREALRKAVMEADSQGNWSQNQKGEGE